jgi:hypothetical protein
MVDTVIVEAETPAVSAVSWPAIIAGGFVAAAFTLLLLALGAGIGFSVISPWSGAPDITTTKAALVGCACAGRALRSTKSISATLHMACWPGPSPR